MDSFQDAVEDVVHQHLMEYFSTKELSQVTSYINEEAHGINYDSQLSKIMLSSKMRRDFELIDGGIGGLDFASEFQYGKPEPEIVAGFAGTLTIDFDVNDMAQIPSESLMSEAIVYLLRSSLKGEAHNMFFREILLRQDLALVEGIGEIHVDNSMLRWDTNKVPGENNDPTNVLTVAPAIPSAPTTSPINGNALSYTTIPDPPNAPTSGGTATLAMVAAFVTLAALLTAIIGTAIFIQISHQRVRRERRERRRRQRQLGEDGEVLDGRAGEDVDNEFDADVNDDDSAGWLDEWTRAITSIPLRSPHQKQPKKTNVLPRPATRQARKTFLCCIAEEDSVVDGSVVEPAELENCDGDCSERQLNQYQKRKQQAVQKKQLPGINEYSTEIPRRQRDRRDEIQTELQLLDIELDAGNVARIGNDDLIHI